MRVLNDVNGNADGTVLLNLEDVSAIIKGLDLLLLLNEEEGPYQYNQRLTESFSGLERLMKKNNE